MTSTKILANYREVMTAAKNAFNEYADMADYWDDIEEWTEDCALTGNYKDLLENLSLMEEDYGLNRKDYPVTFAYVDLLCRLITDKEEL